MNLSHKSAKHKFNSVKTLLPGLKLWFGHKYDYKNITGNLVEAALYNDNNLHVFYMEGNNTIYLPTYKDQIKEFNPTGISFSFVCNDQKPYTDFFKEAHDYYSKMKINNLSVSVSTYGAKDFHMAKARNESLKSCKYDLVFILDVDVRMSEGTVKKLIDMFTNTRHGGVFNLKNSYVTGNGLYLGQKNILLSNGFDERFKFFWYEDTEFLMNFSKMGILPTIVFADFKILQHERNITSPHWEHNQKLFKKIAVSGRNIDG